jgi:hypothetical protein
MTKNSAKTAAQVAAKRLKRKLKKQRAQQRANAFIGPQWPKKAKLPKKRVGVPTSALVPKMVSKMKGFDSSYPSKLAMGVMLPYEHGVLMPTTTSVQVSNAKCMDDYMVKWEVPDLLAPLFPIGSTALHLIGQPGCLGYMWHNYSGSSTYSLKFDSSDPTSDDWQITRSIFTAPNAWDHGDTWTLKNAVALGTGHRHGKTMGILDSNNEQYLWYNAGDKLYLQVTTATNTSTGNTNIKFNVVRYARPREDPTQFATVFYQLASTVTSGPFSMVFSAPQSGYYGVQFENVDFLGAGLIGPLFVKASLEVAEGPAYTQVCMATLDPWRNGDVLLGVSCRLSGSALLLTNTTAIIQRGGSIHAARQEHKNWYDFSFEDLIGVRERYDGDATNGCYTFREFNEVADKFFPATRNGAGLFFSLDQNDWVHTIAIQPASGLTMNVIFQEHIEFRSDSDRYSRRIANGKVEDMHEARKIVNGVHEWFFENPNHMKYVYKIANAALKNANHIGAGFASAFPTQAMPIMALANMLSQWRINR